MAIDTAEKRNAALMARVFRGIMSPNGVVSLFDRAVFLGQYGFWGSWSAVSGETLTWTAIGTESASWAQRQSESGTWVRQNGAAI